eukprot:CAMPEP_0184042876 /NCGR_PEP_ID=MMETSP0955-20130417/66602_1 /TAXON_ID=627963 /ORGANISM="Aplanochytrium sp, Strain PBS07" /LENGTH=157 /DNA_ID=CAMNT_0026333705 /DNA_START=73 /DNA_END=547 /DNA_ORIENTATION=+
MKDFVDFQSALIGLRNGEPEIQVVSEAEDSELGTFSAELRTNTTCKVVDLHGAKLTSKPRLQLLTDLLRGNSALTHLGLGGIGLGTVGAQAIAEGVKENTTLNSLDLVRNDLKDSDVAIIKEALSSSSVISLDCMERSCCQSQDFSFLLSFYEVTLH